MTRNSLNRVAAVFSTQESADLLNISHSFLLEKIASGELLHHNLSQHCRINFSDLIVYKDQIDLATAQGLDEMVSIFQDLELYD